MEYNTLPWSLIMFNGVLSIGSTKNCM